LFRLRRGVDFVFNENGVRDVADFCQKDEIRFAAGVGNRMPCSDFRGAFRGCPQNL
jgi:hypothetical protein